MNEIYIWWLESWFLHVAFSMLEQSQQGVMKKPILPGHLQLAMRRAENQRHPYHGELLCPITLSDIPEDHLDSLPETDNLANVLRGGWFGIPFEAVHYDVVKHYPGIITRMDLGHPDLCALRESLAEGTAQ